MVRTNNMSTMNLTLPDSLKAFVESRIAKRGFGSADDYVEALILEDQEKAEREEIEGKLLDALQGAAATTVTPETWEAVKREGSRRLEARKSQ
jgi:antitoxin ParD1/3/4